MTQTSFHCGAYRILSWGNGTAYSIHKEHQAVWLQGDDATQLSKDTDNFATSSALDELFLNYFTP